MIDVSTRAARALFYASQSWRILREQALERDHYECVWCREEGKVTTENLEVDHIYAKNVTINVTVVFNFENQKN